MLASKSACGVLVGAILVASVAANEPQKAVSNQENGNNAAAAFERLKKLAGDWELANPKDAAEKGKTAVRYHVTSGGSAVVETIFPGTEHEMLTVYHRDGDQLVLTHYCVLGNQPRARAKFGSDKDEIAFEFAGGCCLNADKDAHMHNFRVRFIDADHLHEEAQLYAGGKAGETHGFDLVRKK